MDHHHHQHHHRFLDHRYVLPPPLPPPPPPRLIADDDIPAASFFHHPPYHPSSPNPHPFHHHHDILSRELDHHLHHHHHHRDLYVTDRVNPNLWDRRPPPPMMMIQDMELDVERMSPCLPASFELERMSPPLVPLVRVDSGRRGEYDIGVSRLRDERDEVDVGVYGRKFGGFGMNSDHVERSLGFRDHRATSPVKFRQMERNSGHGELIMLPEGQVRFLRDVLGDLVVDDWKHGEMRRDECCSPFRIPGAVFEQDRERGRSPFRMPGSGFEQDSDGVFRRYENGKKVVLGSQRNADWDRRGVQQHNHTPRKKLTPKKSVLLRMQPSNNSFRNRIDNNSGANQERVREDREGSPVELDVTFKSNALVAKAVKTPLASVVVCDKGSSPKVIESKVMSFEVSGSISNLVVVSESAAKINSDLYCGSESYTPIKDREHSEEKARRSSSLKELNHVASNCRKSPSTSQSLSVKETSRSSPQVVASDKEGVTVHRKASPSSSRKKRKITRPPSSGLQLKVKDLTNVGTLLSSLPGDSLSNNHEKIHEDLTSFAKFTDNDAGLCASATVVDGLVDDTISEGASLMNRKRKQSVVKDLRDSFTDAIGNEGVADPSGSVDGIPPISDSDESFKKSPDKSSSSLGNDEANDNTNSLDPNLLRIGCGDGSSEFLLPDMVHFDDRTLDSQNNTIQEVQPCADSSICVSKNGPVVVFQEKICFNGTLAASTVSIGLSKEHLPVASDSKKHSEVKFSVEDGNVSSEISGKQMHAPSEIGISEVSSAGNFVDADWSNSKDIKICEGQSSAEAYSLRPDVALCSAIISAADSKESTTELNVLGTIHKHTLGETFVVSSSARPAEGSLEVHIEGHICSGIGNDSDSIKKRNADADVTLMGSTTDNVDTGSITDAATTFSCTIEAEQPGEDRSTEYRCSIDSSPCSNEPHSSHDFSLTDSFMAQSAVSAFNSDFMVAFPPCKKQKFLPQHVCSSETLLELHGTPVSSELPVVDKLVLSHPTGDSVELVVVKQASGSVPAFECNSAGLTELPEKIAVCRTSITFPSVADEFNDKLLESDPSSFDPCAIVKQSSLVDDRSPCLSESGICNIEDKQGLMDSANYKNQITDAVILCALPDENGLDDGDVKNQHNQDLQVELLDKDSECGLLAKDAAEHQNYSPVEDEPLLSNCSEVHTEPTHRDVMAITSSKVDALSDVVNQESRCTLNPELPTTVAAVAVNSSSDLKLSTSHQDFNGKSLVGGGPPMSMSMSMSRAFTRTSNIKLKSGGGVAGSGHSGNTCSFLSQAAQKAWPVSNSTSREQYEGKNALNYHGRKFGSRRPFIATPSSKKTSTSYNMKPRTWHRTDESASSNISVKATSLNTIPPRKTSFKKSANIQGNTYIRKGTNSIVRTPAAAAVHGTRGLNAIPDQSNPTTILTARSNGSSISESELDGASNHLCTEGDCSLLEMPKTPPLPCSNNSSNRNILSWDECRTSSSADASVAAEIEVVKPSVKVPKSSQPEVSSEENMKDQYVGSDGYLDSGNKNKLVYKKGKSNQLVAASKQPFSSSTRYFKRSINQLVRASSKSHIQSTVMSCKATSKHRKSSLVWTLHDSTSLSNKGRNLLHCRKLLPNLLPWKRPTWRRSLFPSAYLTTANSIPVLRRKLLSSRKRDVIYTRSGRGFTLRRSKVVSVGGRSLKWSKSIEKLSKKANKAATLAVAEMDGKKREKIHMVGGAKKENQSRDRIFRIGMFRYRMDHSGRTLQRISDEEPTSSATGSTAKHVRKPYVPKRLLVGNDEYVQVGNGNQLIRDPKRRIRILASEKVKWSLHTARMRLVKKKKYCLFFTRFGKCNKDEGKCPYIHDASKIAVCTKFLNGICFDPDCTLTHQVIPERMPDCSFFLQGMCSNRSCPYRHVNVNPKAGICENFLKGYCVDGNECRKKHSYICPAFEATGSCPDEPKCKLYHPRKGKVNKWRSSEDPKNSKGRYFGLGDASILEPGSFFHWKLIVPKSDDDRFLSEGGYVEYISLHVSDEGVGEDDEDSVEEQIKPENELSCALLQNLDELIKPVRILRKSRPTELASASTSSG